MNDVRQLTDSMRSHSPSAMNLKLVSNVAAAAAGVGGNDIVVVVVVVVVAAALSIPHVERFYTHQHGIVDRARRMIFFFFLLILFRLQCVCLPHSRIILLFEQCVRRMYRFVCVYTCVCLNVCSIAGRFYSFSRSLPSLFHFFPIGFSSFAQYAFFFFFFIFLFFFSSLLISSSPPHTSSPLCDEATTQFFLLRIFYVFAMPLFCLDQPEK